MLSIIITAFVALISLIVLVLQHYWSKTDEQKQLERQLLLLRRTAAKSHGLLCSMVVAREGELNYADITRVLDELSRAVGLPGEEGFLPAIQAPSCTPNVDHTPMVMWLQDRGNSASKAAARVHAKLRACAADGAK